MTKDEALNKALEALDHLGTWYSMDAMDEGPRTDEPWIVPVLRKVCAAVDKVLTEPDPKDYKPDPQPEPPPECQTEAEKKAFAFGWWKAMEAQRLAQPQQEPVAWMPIEEMYPQAKAIDILMGDGSILCAVLPQFDGDLWWEGSGTGEKFIDPKYANVTHWRIHSEHTTPPQRKPLDERERAWIVATCPTPRHIINAVEAAHGIKENT